jgi:SHS2 domain-containing protein
MNASSFGYREREHTADWELEAWAPDLPGLYEQAARGMYALANVRLKDGPPLSRTLSLSAYDSEGLLVAFLAELLFLGSVEHGEGGRLGFDSFDISINGNELHATVIGAPILSLDKEIKAVTYHNLKIRRTAEGFRVNLVFDV